MHIHNFSPGPAALPKEVLAQAQQELCNWQGRGYSVMEVSHRSPQYIELLEDTTTRLRQLLDIPDNYRVLYLTLAASAHFSLFPINICKEGSAALYLNTGHWSKKASEHAGTQVAVTNIDIDPNDPHKAFCAIQAIDPHDYAYAHFCPNETIEGIAWDTRPNLPPELPLVGDFSSCLLSAPLNVSDYAIIYAGAQKNIGPAGISLMIVREDMLGKARNNCPPACNYTLQAEHNSLMHTPNTFGIYLINLVCQWLEAQGGIQAMQTTNQAKAQLLYQNIDELPMYRNQVPALWRSIMNVPFQLANPQLDGDFLRSAEEQGLLFLKGHRAVGGMRASLYNAVTMESVEALVKHMQQFAKTH